MRHSLGSDDVNQEADEQDNDPDSATARQENDVQPSSIVASVGSSALGSVEIEPAPEHTDNDGETNAE